MGALQGLDKFNISGPATAPVHGSQVYSTPGTYSFTVPNGINQLTALIASGGGGGGGKNSTTNGGGGGGAGSVSAKIVVTPGQVIPIVVGTGGLSGAFGADGGNGSSSSVGSISVTGGGGGKYLGSGGTAGVITGGDYPLPTSGNAANSTLAGKGGSSIFSIYNGPGAGGNGGGSDAGSNGVAGGNGQVVIWW